MELRKYQYEALQAVDDRIADGHRRVLLQLPTGGGKTATIAHRIARWASEGKRVLFLAGLDALVGDTHERLTKLGIDAGFIQSGRPSRPEAPVQVCSWHTLFARELTPPADVIVIDEAQHCGASQLRKWIDRYPHAAFVGLSATPERADGIGLGDSFDALVEGPTIRELIDARYLVPITVVAPGDYVEKGLSMDPVRAHLEFTRRRPTILFAQTLAHARDYVARLSAAGVPSAMLHAKTRRADREDLRAALMTGELEVIVNCRVLLEGWDCPSVSGIIIAATFGSLNDYLQGIGRGTRTAPGKTDCLVVDLKGAYTEHGLPDDPRNWSLAGPARVGEQLPAIRRCLECGAVFAPAKRCPRCGAERTVSALTPKQLRAYQRQQMMIVVSRMPLWQRDEKYLARCRWIAVNRMRLPSHRVEGRALAMFVAKHKRHPAPRPA